MATVVDSSNLVEFIATGKVPEFKPPEATGSATAPGTPSTPGAAADGKQPRDPVTKQFTTRDAGDKTTTAAPPSDKKDGGERGSDPLTEATKAAIDKKHRQMKEAEERERRETIRAIEAEKRAESLQRELEASKTKSGRASDPSEPPKEPKPEDFTTVGEYTDALVTYRVDQRLREQEAKRVREAEQRQKEAREREFGQRVTKAREQHDDFDSVLSSVKGTDLDRVPQDVVEYMTESEHGPELLYHLAKNPDVLRRLRDLSPRRFIAELGKLEVQWEKQAAAPASEKPATLTDMASTIVPPVSKAPAPIVPMDTTGIAPVAKKPEDMSVAELRAYRQQQQRQARAR